MIVGVREKSLTLFTTWLYIVVFTMPGISACRCSARAQAQHTGHSQVVHWPFIAHSRVKKDGALLMSVDNSDTIVRAARPARQSYIILLLLDAFTSILAFSR